MTLTESRLAEGTSVDRIVLGTQVVLRVQHRTHHGAPTVIPLSMAARSLIVLILIEGPTFAVADLGVYDSRRVLFQQVMGSSRAATRLHIDVTLLSVHTLASCSHDLLRGLLFALDLLLANIDVLCTLIVCIELVQLLEVDSLPRTGVGNIPIGRGSHQIAVTLILLVGRALLLCLE